MSRTLTVIAFLLLLHTVAGQKINKRDSLLRLLVSAKEDTNKVKLFYGLAFYYEMNHQDSAAYYLERTKALADSLHYTKGIYLYYDRSTVLAYSSGNYTGALEKSKTGLALARQLKDSSLVIVMLGNMGIAYMYLNNFVEQLNYTLQAKNTLEMIKDSSKISPMYHNLANCYLGLGQYRKSADCDLFSIRLYQEFKKRNDYINRVFASLAKTYTSLNKPDSALYYFEIGAKESVANKDVYAEAFVYLELCDLYRNLQQFSKIPAAAEKSMQLAKQLQNNEMTANALYNMAVADFYNGKPADADNYIKQAISISKRDSLKNVLQNCYGLLSYIAASNGQLALSVQAKNTFDSIRDAALNDQIVASTADMEKKYETEKKDKQIILQQSQLQKRKTFIYILVASAAALVIITALAFGFYFQKQRLQQQRIAELETEKKLTATEAVLKGEEQERARLAKDLHDGLGGMLSGIKFSMNTMKGNLIMTPDNQRAFERSMDMLDSSIQEMRRVAHNMMPETLVKFGLDTALKDFCNDINQSGALQVSYQSIGMDGAVIDQTTAVTIYRIVQELINNSIKHAGAQTAIVQITRTGDLVSVTVEDDGKGFDTQQLQQSKGIGWINIQHRVEFLKGKLDVHASPDKGTSVLIEITLP